MYHKHRHSVIGLEISLLINELKNTNSINIFNCHLQGIIQLHIHYVHKNCMLKRTAEEIHLPADESERFRLHFTEHIDKVCVAK